MSNGPPSWMDVKRLCAEICVTRSTVYKWVAEGILPPPYHRGGRVLWKWSEVDRQLTMGRVEQDADPELGRITDGTRAELAAQR